MTCSCKLWIGKGLVLLIWSLRQQLLWHVQVTAAIVLSNTTILGAAVNTTTFSATDVSALMTMKGAAKCNKHSELHVSVNQSDFECMRCFWDIFCKQICFRIPWYTLIIYMLCHVKFVHIKSRTFDVLKLERKLNKCNAKSHLLNLPKLQLCVPLHF